MKNENYLDCNKRDYIKTAKVTQVDIDDKVVLKEDLMLINFSLINVICFYYLKGGISD